MTDWRLPQNRREAFQRFYTFHLRTKAHPGLVYSWLPALAEAFELTPEGRAWLVWLNGNTQNPATSLLLLEASDGDPRNWRSAVDFWNTNFTKLAWDTDRRHQKSKFGVATEQWANTIGPFAALDWVLLGSWDEVWKHAFAHPYMGRLSAWSMTEYARILFGPAVPDAATMLLEDHDGSRSHRNGLAIIDGAPPEAAHWDWSNYNLGYVQDLAFLAEGLLSEARVRNPDNLQDTTRLTLESALCTYKSWHKPNRRYPGVYADMAHGRLKQAEERFGPRFEVLWEARRRDLPEYLRLEDNPGDPGLSPIKQNWYMNTGQIPMLHHMFPDMEEVTW